MSGGLLMKYAISLMALLSLTGCITLAEQQKREDDAKCSSYGAKRGDPAYVQCRAQLDAARTNANAIASAAPQPDYLTPHWIVPPPQPQFLQLPPLPAPATRF